MNKIINNSDDLWSRIPWPDALDICDTKTGLERNNRWIEVCEILASVLWRLQLAAALGSFPREPMDDVRKNYHQETYSVAWKEWSRLYPDVSVRQDSSSLQVSLNFPRGMPAGACPLLQSSVIADAAIRLGGISGLVKWLTGSYGPLDREVARNWVISGARREDREGYSTAYVLSFRDAYMHGALDSSGRTAKYPERRFRSNMWKQEPLEGLYESCVRVWQRTCQMMEGTLLARRQSASKSSQML